MNNKVISGASAPKSRADKRAAALRQNLLKRKRQTRARDQSVASSAKEK
jgi:hypothetical protein